jgi:hypothetical protein
VQHQFGHTCHDEDIVGTAPVLMASRNDCVNPARIGPVMVLAPSCLGLVRSNTNFVKASRPDVNSGRNVLNCKQGDKLSIHKEVKINSTKMRAASTSTT